MPTARFLIAMSFLTLSPVGVLHAEDDERKYSMEEDWAFITVDGNGAQYYLAGRDRAPILDGEDIATAWIKADFRHDKTKKIRSSMNKISVKCRNDEMAEVAVYEYMADGSISYRKINYYPKYEPIVPDSIGEKIAKDICIEAVINFAFSKSISEKDK